jgi:hypothetical protein
MQSSNFTTSLVNTAYPSLNGHGCGATIIKLVDLETGTVVDSREMGSHGFNADVNHTITREMVRTALARGWWV